MMKKQIYNPYLPLEEYVPDAEPHVFDGRVYVYGSHDREDGETFCMLDYVCYSAPVEDLRSWRYEGVIYQAAQDPDYRKKDSIYSPVVREYLYAPDVVYPIRRQARINTLVLCGTRMGPPCLTAYVLIPLS